MAQVVKSLPAIQETRVRSLSWEDPLEEGKATHSSILAWRIPWREESGGLQSIGLQRMKWLSMHWSYFIHSKRSLVSSSHFSFKKQIWKLSPFLPVCCAHIILLILMCFKRNSIFISKFVYYHVWYTWTLLMKIHFQHLTTSQYYHSLLEF